MGVAGRTTSVGVPVAYMILNEILIAILDTTVAYRENAALKSQSVGLAHARPMMAKRLF